MIKSYYGDNLKWWFGVVINTKDDPLETGRAKVRIYGVHGTTVPDRALPWASVIVPTTEGGVSGIGQNPLLKPGARVIGFFLDGDEAQNPVIWGSLPGIEGSIEHTAGPAVGTSGPANESTVAPLKNPSDVSGGYPADLSRGEIEGWIRQESVARGINPEVAITVFRHEGAGSYQSSVPRSGKGSLNGREASFGPYQLYVGGGLGNDYQKRTGRSLVRDNTRDGILNQIRYSLDQAALGGWSPWYGFDAAYGRRRDSNNRPTDLAHYRRGLTNATAINNWG